MCLGVPVRVVALAEDNPQLGIVDWDGARREVNLSCLVDEHTPPAALLGSWVIVHLGFALQRVDEAQAAQIRALLAELAATRSMVMSPRGAARPPPKGVRLPRGGPAAG